ncbi:Type II secretion system F domain protein [Methanocaldococcus lauensis]|nr:Type II secretion system F domain protein [Methanocaldococcus lauensis]
MNKYIEFIYYKTIKRNIIILRKLGRNIDEKMFLMFILFVLCISVFIGVYFHLSLKGIAILSFLYTGTAISLPTILYENKIEALENNIPKALYVMILALESGRSINEALDEVVKSNIKEVSTVFKRVLYLMEKQKISFEEAITVVSTLYGSDVLKMLSKILIENRKYGGDLAEPLKILAKTLEDLKLYKRQLLSVTGTGLALGFIILCGVVPAICGLLGAYFIATSKMLSGMSPLPPVTPEDISRGLEIIQMGTVIIGLLFAIPIFGLKIERMFLISSITMTSGILVYYGILKVASGLFT